MLTEPEAKAAIAAYGIPVPETIVATTVAEVRAAAASLLENSEAIVVKLLSKAVSHKSDIGGVVLNIASADAAAQRRRGDRRARAHAGAASRHRRLCGAADGRAQAGAGTDPRHEPRPDLRAR